MIRRYSELIKIPTFIERYRYLKLSGSVGVDTFGFDRWLNQKFYKTPEYRKVRLEVILRDNGCDLGVDEFEIAGKVIIHHMNPITQTDILKRSDFALDPEYMICVSHGTHNAIHYGDERLLPVSNIIERKPNDTIPWKRS